MDRARRSRAPVWVARGSGQPYRRPVHTALLARRGDRDGIGSLRDADEPFNESFVVDSRAREEAEEDAAARRAAIEVADLRLLFAHQDLAATDLDFDGFRDAVAQGAVGEIRR